MKPERIEKAKVSKITYLLVYILTITLCITGCTVRGGAGNNDSSNEGELMKPSICTTTDINAVVKLFPSLEGAESVEMEQLKYGGSSSPRSLPTPADYQYRGYITLSDEAAEKYGHDYSFTDANPKVSFEILKERNGHWKYSYKFKKKIIKSGLVGDVWLDGNILLFSVGTM